MASFVSSSESGSHSSLWRAGQRVEVQGLQTRPELNGRTGEVVEVLANVRVKVKLDNDGPVSDPTAPQFLSVKPDSLRLSTKMETKIVSPVEDLSLDDEKRGLGLESLVVPSFSPVITVWYNTSFFYAFGNSCAKRLTAFLPPDQTTATVLMLGCGDFRHILFTNWCHRQTGGTFRQTRLNVVACDLRPSIMSRNLLLLKLIYDGVAINQAWMIFYSKFLDEACLHLLAATATSLLALGGTAVAGSDAESEAASYCWHTWNNSEFGRCCPFVNEQSFRLVCELWRFYTKPIPLGSKWDRQLKDHGQRLAAGSTVLFNANASPAIFPALKTAQEQNQTLRKYADGDVHLFRSIYAFPSGSHRQSMACNPMLLEGPRVQEVQLHYGADPTGGYHTSLCYGPLQDAAATGMPGLVQCTSPDAFRSEMMVTNAFTEFSAWCAATKERLDRQLVQIHVVVCDAFDLVRVMMARQLQQAMSPAAGHADTKQGLETIREDVPTTFDVIDTSNMADHCGLLNVLLACQPLLRRHLHSTLLTENISSFSKDTMALSTLVEPWLGTNLETFAVLTGLVPVDYPSTTSCHLKDALVMKYAVNGEHSNLFLRWKHFATAAAPVAVDNTTSHDDGTLRVSLTEDTFVEMFHRIYCRLFETVLHPVASWGDPRSKSPKAILADTYINSTPQTFAMLLSTCMHRMASLPSSKAIRALVDRIFATKYLLQGHANQETLAWLAYYHVVSPLDMQQICDYTLRVFDVRWNDPHVRSLLAQGRRENETTISSPVNDLLLYVVTLLVPKEVIDRAVANVVTPIFELIVSCGEKYENGFRNVKLQYLRTHPPIDEASHWTIDNLTDLCTSMDQCTVVACSALMPVTCLALKGSLDVELRLSTTMITKNPTLPLTLGPKLVVYRSTLTDRSSVSWRQIRPNQEPWNGLWRHTYHPSTPVELRSHSSRGQVIAKAHPAVFSANPLLLTVKVEFDDAHVLKQASPTVKQLPTPHEIAVVVSSSCIVHVRFPLPIDTGRVRMQISRTKGFLYLLATPLSPRSVPDRFAHLYVDSGSRRRLCLYGTPYICLEALPAVQVGPGPRSELTKWFLTLFGVAMSATERQAQRVDSPHRTGIGAWKESIALFLHHMAPETESPAVHLFSLKGPAYGNEIILFVNALRIEHTMDRSLVFDVAVCLLEKAWARDVVAWLMRLNPLRKREIQVTLEEMAFWKRLLPAAIEKARTQWTHRSSCEYQRTTCIPLCDDGNGEKIVCSCGLGQQLDGTLFAKELQTARATHLSAYFARAAVPLIFSLDEG